MTPNEIDELVSRMQSAESADVAEAARLRLELSVLPNQVLRAEAPLLVDLLAAGLSAASVHGEHETWELLAQLIAGACEPTAAAAEVVSQVREAMSAVLPVAIERVRIGAPSGYDSLVVDVLDAALSIAGTTEESAIADALRQFGRRGPRERERVEVILGDQASS